MSKIWQQMFGQTSITGDAIKFLIHYKTYKEKYKFIKESEWWSKEKLEEYQLKELNKLLNHAYKNVPYYTNLFNNLGLKPHDIQDLKDLIKIPFLTKKIIKENFNDFKAKNYRKNKFEYITTGGSTDTPLGFYIEHGVAEASHIAYVQNLLDRANCRLTHKHIYLLGRDKLYDPKVLGRILVFSSFHMTEDNLSFFIKKIKKFKPEFILGYPSAITILVKYMNKNKIVFFPGIKAVFCSGETIYDWQKDLIERTFNCRIYGYYGHTEQVVFAGTCERSYYYHVNPQYGITELIDRKGQQITHNNETGEIVATGFNNYVFPIIRYKTEDVGVYTTNKCKCERNYILLKRIEGRTQDFIVSRLKRIIPITGVNGLLSDYSKNVKKWQLYQEKHGELILKIVKTSDYKDFDENTIKKSFQKKFGDEFKLIIDYVDNIPLTSRGKHKFLVQKLQI